MIRLHGYWRSTASYRIRIALGLKGLAYDQATYDLRTAPTVRKSSWRSTLKAWFRHLKSMERY